MMAVCIRYAQPLCPSSRISCEYMRHQHKNISLAALSPDSNGQMAFTKGYHLNLRVLRCQTMTSYRVPCLDKHCWHSDWASFVAQCFTVKHFKWLCQCEGIKDNVSFHSFGLNTQIAASFCGLENLKQEKLSKFKVYFTQSQIRFTYLEISLFVCVYMLINA